MNTITALTVLAAEEHLVVNPLFLPAPVIGVGSFLLFLLMLAAVMGLRSVGRRHEVPGVDDYHQGRGYDEREHSHWGTH